MGLAATQARFLTITSRLSNNEHRQQGLSMMKMRLAADQSAAAAKYSDILNNQTLTANGKNISITALEDMGYGIIRTSDSEKASKAATVSHTTYTKPEPVAPQKPANVRLSAPTAPVDRNKAKQEKINKLITSLTSTDIPGLLENMTNNSAKILAGTIDEKTENTPEVDYAADYYNAKKDILDDVLDLVGKLESYCAGDSQVVAAAQKLNNDYVKPFETAISKDNKTEKRTYENGSRTAIVNLPVSSQTMATVKTTATNLNTGIKNVIASVTSYYNNVQPDYDKTEAQYQQELTAYKSNKAEWDAYDKKYAQYKKDYEDYLASAVTTTEEIAENELYTNCKNDAFLIQGLLSGYLSLVKDEKVVSLDANTDILTEYDKSDDAAAEAEYESTMKKINIKEKAIDNQMRRLDTEYSALKVELQSVQNILSQHASNDFQLFS